MLDAVIESDKVSREVIGFHMLTPFGAVYRYDDYDGAQSLNRAETRAMLRSLRAWVEDRLLMRSVAQAT